MEKYILVMRDNTHTEKYFYEIREVTEEKTFAEKAAEVLRERYGKEIEMTPISPFGFEGKYGFYIDVHTAEAKEFSLPATAVYYNPYFHTANLIYMHPIIGDVVVGKWIETANGAELDFLTYDEAVDARASIYESLIRYNSLEE